MSSLDLSDIYSGGPTSQGQLLSAQAFWIPTNVNRQVSDRRKEDFDVGASDQFRIHSTGVLKECSTEQGLRTSHRQDKYKQSGEDHNVDSHAKTLCDPGQIPYRLDGGLAGSDLYSGICVTHRAIRIFKGPRFQDNVPIDCKLALSRRLV